MRMFEKGEDGLVLIAFYTLVTRNEKTWPELIDPLIVVKVARIVESLILLHYKDEM